MEILLKIILIIALLLVFFQDLKSRSVMVILLIATGILFALQMYFRLSWHLFLMGITVNLAFVCGLCIVLYVCTKFIIKKPFSNAIGLGDLFFFGCMALGFPTMTFLILFSFSLFFAALLYVFLRKKLMQQTVPLAGFQSLFIAIVLLVSWNTTTVDLYLL